MSVTTTQNPVYQTVTQILTDYDIRHSGGPQASATPATGSLNSRPPPAQQQGRGTNPETWPVNHRRVPPFRPIDRNLDFEQRPWGSNAIETAFITTMFTGVFVNAGAAQVWRSTLGGWTGIDIKYPIGGQR